MRIPILAGNWKMNKTISEALALVESLKPVVNDVTNVEVAVAPPFTALKAVSDTLHGSRIALAAQDMHPEPSGAFTGEISGPMLADVGCRYVIIAHSERRQFFGETSETANRKIKAAYAHGLAPIYCVGETLAQREAGETETLIRAQITEGLDGCSARQIHNTVIAYEPVWAIGTGRTATPAQAQEIHALIRATLTEIYGPDVAETVRIQYGGSVKPDNIAELMSQRDVDGALVGGASLQAASFAAMAQSVASMLAK
jgi:triosephosphate isomerase